MHKIPGQEETAAPNAAETTQPTSTVDDLFRRLSEVNEAIPQDQRVKASTEEAKSDTDSTKKVEDGAPEKKDAPAEKPADHKPVSVRKKKIKLPEIPKESAPPATATATQTEDASKPPSELWEDTLSEEDKLILDDAKFAESKIPAHKGLSSRVEKWMKDRAAFLEKNPDVDENDPAYQALLRQRPSLSALDQRKLNEIRFTDRAKSEVDNATKEMEYKLFIRDEEPKIRQQADKIFTEIANTALPDDLVQARKDLGHTEFVKAYKAELEIANTVASTVVSDIAELRRITTIHPKTGRPLSPIATNDTDPKKVQHDRIKEMVNGVSKAFLDHGIANGNAGLIRDGKRYVTLSEWGKLSDYQRQSAWTLGIDEIVKIAIGGVKGAIQSKIKAEHDRLTSRGWQRVLPAKPAVKAEAKPTQTPPTLKPAPIPPGASQGTGQDPLKAFGASLAGFH